MDAFEVAWLLLKEEVEEEPPEDPTPPPMGFRQRVKNAMSNMGAMFGQGSLKDKFNTIRQQQAQQQQAHEEAFQAQQQTPTRCTDGGRVRASRPITNAS